MLESHPNTVELIRREYNDAWERVSQLGLSKLGKEHIAVEELTSALVTYCMPKSKELTLLVSTKKVGFRRKKATVPPVAI